VIVVFQQPRVGLDMKAATETLRWEDRTSTGVEDLKNVKTLTILICGCVKDVY
jgi:hypothetical protein